MHSLWLPLETNFWRVYFIHGDYLFGLPSCEVRDTREFFDRLRHLLNEARDVHSSARGHRKELMATARTERINNGLLTIKLSLKHRGIPYNSQSCSRVGSTRGSGRVGSGRVRNIDKKGGRVGSRPWRVGSRPSTLTPELELSIFS